MSANITIALPLETIATLQANKSGSLPRAAAQQITQAVKAAAKALPVDLSISKERTRASSTKSPSDDLAASPISESSKTPLAGRKRRHEEMSEDSEDEDEDETDEDLNPSPKKSRMRRDHRIMHERGLSPQSFQLFVKTFTGKSVTLEVDGFWQAKALKRMIEEKIGLAPNHQRLIYAGRQLEDTRTLEVYGIKKESTVQLWGRLRGT